MQFRTIQPPTKFPFQISYENRTLLLGSCFSDHIGSFLLKNRFFVLSNPFGTLFNPISIANALKMTMTPELFSQNYRFFFDNRWVSFAHHGSFSHSNEKQFLERIEQQWIETKSFLEKTDFLFITFGTAYCYRFLERDLIVANCHKIPNSQFQKFRLEIDEIVQTYQDLLQKLQQINPILKTIFTVSPVRHLGGGFHENQLSKSVLHLTIEELSNNENVFYFPSYELLMDDLRDYRFYAEDLCHVGENALRYIEEFFSETFFSPLTQEQQKEIEKEYKFLNHRHLK
jgi:hypothetical protein